MLIWKVNWNAVIDGEPHRHDRFIGVERRGLVFEGQAVVHAIRRIKPSGVARDADRAARDVGRIALWTIGQAAISLDGIDHLLQSFTAVHVRELMPEAINKFALRSVQPVGGLNEQRLDISAGQATFGQPGIRGSKP